MAAEIGSFIAVKYYLCGLALPIYGAIRISIHSSPNHDKLNGSLYQLFLNSYSMNDCDSPIERCHSTETASRYSTSHLLPMRNLFAPDPTSTNQACFPL